MGIKWSRLSDEQIDYFTTTGRLYGYPECCINSFLDAVNELEATGECVNSRTAVQVKYSFQGFVPCNTHASYIDLVGYDSMIKIINKARQFKFPFPIDLQIIKELYDELNNQIEKLPEECVCEDCKNGIQAGHNTQVSSDLPD
jgi:hypothetical protein